VSVSFVTGSDFREVSKLPPRGDEMTIWLQFGGRNTYLWPW